VPFRLSWVPSRSMYRLGGEVGRSWRVDSMVEIWEVVEMNVTVAMVWLRDLCGLT